MEWLSSKIDAALTWIGTLVQSLVTALFQMLSDVVVSICELFLNGVAAVMGAIPVPGFLDGGLQLALNGIDPAVLYFLGRSGFGAALGILGAGFTFRMLRKLFTLGQW